MESVTEHVQSNLEALGRLAQGKDIMRCISDCLAASVWGQTVHMCVYGSCQGGKSDIHALCLTQACVEHVYSASITKGKDNSQDMAFTKLPEKCPRYSFKVDCLPSSKAGAARVIAEGTHTSWVMFAGEAQLRHFMHGLSELQTARPPVVGLNKWLLVLDESDAYAE